jgi:DNA repair protein RadA/Sms
VLRLVEVDAAEAERIGTGVAELDRVLGGGLVPASLVLVGGEPGVGKSTLLLMALQAMSETRRSLLVTGEESVAQVKLRAARWAVRRTSRSWRKPSSTRSARRSSASGRTSA